MLEIPRMFLVTAVLWALAFSARETLETVGKELNTDELVSRFENDIKLKSQIENFKTKKHDVSKNKGGSGFTYNIKSLVDYTKIKKRDISRYSKCREVLVFDEMETVKRTLKEFEKQIEKNDAAFAQYYSDLNDDELFKKQQEVGYNKYQPLVNFDNHLGFRSINADYIEAEDRYLKQKHLREEDDPDNHFIGQPEERALLNGCNEIMVDGIIYRLTENGYYEINVKDGDFRKLEKVDDDTEYISEDVRFVSGHNSRSMRSRWYWWRCYSWRYRWGTHTWSSKRISWHLSHWTFPWGSIAAATTKNYIRRWGRWHRYYTRCAAMVYGYYSRDPWCRGRYPINWYGGNVWRWRAHLCSHRVWLPRSRVKSGWVRGLHYGATSSFRHSSLF